VKSIAIGNDANLLSGAYLAIAKNETKLEWFSNGFDVVGQSGSIPMRARY
jgi:hypothetical protein